MRLGAITLCGTLLAIGVTDRAERASADGPLAIVRVSTAEPPTNLARAPAASPLIRHKNAALAAMNEPAPVIPVPSSVWVGLAGIAIVGGYVARKQPPNAARSW